MVKCCEYGVLALRLIILTTTLGNIITIITFRYVYYRVYKTVSLVYT